MPPGQPRRDGHPAPAPMIVTGTSQASGGSRSSWRWKPDFRVVTKEEMAECSLLESSQERAAVLDRELLRASTSTDIASVAACLDVEPVCNEESFQQRSGDVRAWRWVRGSARLRQPGGPEPSDQGWRRSGVQGDPAEERLTCSTSARHGVPSSPSGRPRLKTGVGLALRSGSGMLGAS